MNVALSDIPLRGLEITLGEWARAAAAEAITGSVAEFGGTLLVTRHEEHVAVRGPMRMRCTVGCDRCGEPLSLTVAGDFSCLYSPLASLPETREDEEGVPAPPIQLDFTVEEVGEYDGAKLDLALVVREWVLVELPARLLCADLDAGEDEACLSRFHEASGLASTPRVDPRFAVLSNFKPNA